MSKRSIGFILFVNFVFLFGIVFVHYRAASYGTRVSFFFMKTQDDSRILQVNKKALDDIQGLQAEGWPDCKVSIEKSVELDTFFFDIACGSPNQAKRLFESYFWRALADGLAEFGRRWDSESSLKDFYYMNHLSEVQLGDSNKVILPRYSFIFQDRLDRVSILDFMVYLVLSLLVLNFFLIKLFSIK